MAHPGVPDERPPTILELALQHQRTPAVLLLILAPLVSWTWIVMMARDMYGPMTGVSAWMMTSRWDALHVLLLWAMWAIMMVGMMLPSASHVLLLYGAMERRSAQPLARRIYAFAAGYLVVWTVFSVGATAVQRVLAAALVITPMMKVSSPLPGATLLLLAGVYQLTPLKFACLRECQSPLGFLMSRWRSGFSGAFRMGVQHGAYCVGCCWALMLLLFVGGVMNLIVIAALTVFVGFEKLTPYGAHGARISGSLLVMAGLWMAIH